MRLLVSVRSAAEIPAAVAGGAEIVDAKEPAHGSLGAVGAPVLRAIAAALPPTMPLSVALGDPRDAAAVAAALGSLAGLVSRPRELYVKVGLAGVRDPSVAEALLAACVEAAARAAVQPDVVAVAYADHVGADAVPRDVVSRLAVAAGARGVLLDTWTKGDGDLFHWIGESELRKWVEEAKRVGLFVALAGSLSVESLHRAAGLPADIVGVRGAACAGGRAGRVEEVRVRALRGVLAGRGQPSVAAV